MRAKATTSERPALTRAWYERPVVEVARDLIGCLLVSGPCSGIIVETEAYHESEPASHAFIGVRPRTEALFGPPGTAYVYLSYGIHELLNAVCEEQGVGAAVLIRALEPIDGTELMAERRGVAPTRLRELCSGPGKLAQAMGVSLADNGSDLSGGPIRILGLPDGCAPTPVSVSRRIGISKAAELPWRFCADGSRFLSRPG